MHGYRQTFEGAVLDAARLSDGIKFRGATMLFSWPSKAGFFDYAYDRESAVWSRDAFERVLGFVMANPTRGRVHIVAHSMGTMLALESLRQIYGRHGDAAASRIGAVIFASPDIDMDIFVSSIQRVGPIAQKITVVTATNDRALALSSRVAGGVTRVGAAEKSQLEQLGLRVVDASGLRLGHHQPRPIHVERRGAPGDPPVGRRGAQRRGVEPPARNRWRRVRQIARRPASLPPVGRQ